jgi:fructose-bisphosphate aldolase class I
MAVHDMESTARALVGPGKGILAADESLPTIQKRLHAVEVAATEENRRAYRQLLFLTPGLTEFISGIILFDETLRQKTDHGVPFPEAITRAGMIPGIKVDLGAKPLAGFSGEKITEGLDDLRERLEEYSRLGARFAKWRAVIAITEETPTRFCLEANAHALARYAALCQEAGLVPIVEPEVLMDGAHTIERHQETTEQAQQCVFEELFAHRVNLRAMLLKPNMVLSGKTCPRQAGVAEVAIATFRCLQKTVPAAVPGIVFLSGGQDDIRATEHLQALSRFAPAPWELSFSFGRALQDQALRIWRGKAANIAAARQALYDRARCNAAARKGVYSDSMEPSGKKF